MHYRTFGRTGVKISEIGLGTWQLGGSDWGEVEEDDALSILHRSVECGVNFIDTANIYGAGRSEELIGRFLRECKTPVYVATKLGRGGEGWPDNFSMDAVRRHTMESLERLGVDRIFLQQWHCIPTGELRRGEVFDHMRTLQSEGLIQHWGVSVESVEEGLICLRHEDCASLQVIFNIFRQKLIDELLPAAKENQTGILARVPLASGLLAGKFGKGHAFPENDHRHYNADGQAFNAGETFAGVPFDRGVEIAGMIRDILKPAGQVSMAQLALRWTLDHDAVSTVIPGASKLWQAESNAASSDLPPLGDDVHRQLQELYREQVAPIIRGNY